MKSTGKILWIGIAVLLATSASSVSAQENGQEQQGHLLNVHDLHVKIGHDREFRDGMSAWKSCYLENDGKGSWGVWRRMQGKAGVYTETIAMDKWAEVDKEDSAANACRDIIREQITPHLSEVSSSIARYRPEVSGNESDYSVVNVVSFRVDDHETFNEIREAVAGSMDDNYAHWYNVTGGGPETEHYFVVIPYEDFAAMDEDRPGPWEQYEKAHGEQAMEAMRQRFDESIDQAWNYHYVRIDELSRSGSD